MFMLLGLATICYPSLKKHRRQWKRLSDESSVFQNGDGRSVVSSVGQRDMQTLCASRFK